MDTSRIHGPTTPLERVHFARDGHESQKDDQEKPKFQLDEEKQKPAAPTEDRERGEVAHRNEDESGGNLDLTV